MTKLQTAIFLINNGYVDTRYYEGKFQVKMNQKGKEAYLLLNRLKELSKWFMIFIKLQIITDVKFQD